MRVTIPKESAADPYALEEIRENQRVSARVILKKLEDSRRLVFCVIFPLSI
jgi:hypothetical protein